MENLIIKRICNSCHCNEQQVREFLNDEISNLRELRDLEDLRYRNMELACSDLGLENDYVQYFINVLAIC